MALFGPNTEELKASARKEYDKAAKLQGDSRREDAYRMKIALRLRTHIDKLFVNAAEKAEKFNESAVLSIAEGKPAPEPPTPSEYIKLMTAGGEIWSYLPQEYANLVFKYGMLYQNMNIDGPSAINKVQKICDACCSGVGLKISLVALEFLRYQLAEEGIDVDASIAALEPDLDEVEF